MQRLRRESVQFPNDKHIKYRYLREKNLYLGLTPEEEAEYKELSDLLTRGAQQRRNPTALIDHPRRKALCRLLRRVKFQKNLLHSALSGASGSSNQTEYRVFLEELQYMGLVAGFDRNDPNAWMYVRLTPAGETALTLYDHECDDWPDFRRRWY